MSVEKFGHRVRRLREEAGLSRYQCGQKSGVNPQTIGVWERGTKGSKGPYIKHLDMFAKSVGIDINQLVSGTDLVE